MRGSMMVAMRRALAPAVCVGLVAAACSSPVGLGADGGGTAGGGMAGGGMAGGGMAGSDGGAPIVGDAGSDSPPTTDAPAPPA
jgi:hypothetical protein